MVTRSLVALCLLAATAHAESKICKIVDIDFLPQQLATPVMYTAPSQIVAWIEDTSGQYVDTVFITQQTGTYGLGNRPGRFDFNSGPKFPYGRRTGVFPVWAHRHGMQFDEVVFQDGDDSNLSHEFLKSTRENHFCRPIDPTNEREVWDTGTCASSVYTDKGTLSSTSKSLYPPRNDVIAAPPKDATSVDMYALLNPFDAVSQPTPVSDVPAQLSWIAPNTLPDGNYVMWVEVSREFDHNGTYSIEARPAPSDIPWSTYGAPYRGQPSIVYKLPFAITNTARSIVHALDYVGYGDPDGLDGNLRVPDDTITTGVAGSGAERFAVRTDNGTPYRVRVDAFVEDDAVKPAAPGTMSITDITTKTARLTFMAPGDDDYLGKVRRYEMRYVASKFMDEDTFTAGIELKPDFQIGDGGDMVSVAVTGLINGTDYTIGVRAYDDCMNRGATSFITFKTPERIEGEVDWCFIATAAYGSTLANDVELLRRFRDTFLQTSVLGELAVEAYYTFGPAIAGVVRESEVVRATARAVLSPIVSTVKVLRW